MSVQHSKAAVPEAAWVKSSYSTGNGGECLEVATLSGVVLVRDSKQPTMAKLAIGPAVWESFLRMAAGK